MSTTDAEAAAGATASRPRKLVNLVRIAEYISAHPDGWPCSPGRVPTYIKRAPEEHPLPATKRVKAIVVMSDACDRWMREEHAPIACRRKRSASAANEQQADAK